MSINNIDCSYFETSPCGSSLARTGRKGLENGKMAELWVMIWPRDVGKGWINSQQSLFKRHYFFRNNIKAYRLVSYLFLMMLTHHAYAFTWQNFGLSEDQKAQQLMQQGDFRTAADLFLDPDWQASAAYRAGEYQQAASRWSSLSTEQSAYNEGNALAHLGRYEAAIKAYDKALLLNPKNQDAIYNRKLIVDLMQKNQNSQQTKNQDKKQEKNKQSDQNEQDKEQNKSNQAEQKEDSKSENTNQAQNSESQSGGNQSDIPKPKNEASKEPKKGQENENNLNQEPSAQDKKDAQAQNPAQDTKEQASDQAPKGEPATSKPENSSTQKSDKAKNAELSTAERERQHAKEQWLRLIPDDPGGLLREKFLRDHLRRRYQSEGAL